MRSAEMPAASALGDSRMGMTTAGSPLAGMRRTSGRSLRWLWMPVR
ncbi:MAG: hypothetical protein IPL28_18045 [Chloroflexi bacterium]|nr:hypothetical protein [Chloroflexota bacterium]